MSFSRILTLLAGAFVSAVLLRRKENPNAAPWRPELEELQKKFTEHLTSHDTSLGEFQKRFETALGEIMPAPDGRIDELAVRVAALHPKIEAIASELATPRSDNRLNDLAGQVASLQPRIEAIATELAAKTDPRVDDLIERLAGLQPKLEALAAGTAPQPDPRIDQLDARVSAVESKADATQDQVASLEQKVNTNDQKLQATSQVVLSLEQLFTQRLGDLDRRLAEQGRSLEAMNSSIAQSDELLERVLDLVQNLPVAEPRALEPVAIASGGGQIRELQL